MIDVQGKTTQQINTLMKQHDTLTLTGILGQRYLGNAFTKGSYELHGTVGNGFASFLSGANFHLYGNGQEGVADTMSSGRVVIHGNCGDALAYGMRGGSVLIEGDCGTRCGVHMKEYGEETLLIIGGSTKNFLGEYLSGGTILVLNKELKKQPIGRYCGMGAHGGVIYARLLQPMEGWNKVEGNSLQRIQENVAMFCEQMNLELSQFEKGEYYQKVQADKNPYEGYYVTR